MRTFSFGSQDAARAFAEGVEYVNDSAVTVREVRHAGEQWDVIIEDQDERNILEHSADIDERCPHGHALVDACLDCAADVSNALWPLCVKCGAPALDGQETCLAHSTHPDGEHDITVVVRVREDDDVSAGAYLDASLAYMCEVADDQRRIVSYRIKGAT